MYVCPPPIVAAGTLVGGLDGASGSLPRSPVYVYQPLKRSAVNDAVRSVGGVGETMGVFHFHRGGAALDVGNEDLASRETGK